MGSNVIKPNKIIRKIKKVKIIVLKFYVACYKK